MPTVASDFSLKRIKGPAYSINDFDLLETIGTGTMSRVRLVRDIETTGFYAMKMMKKHKIVHHNQVRHVLDEVLILSHLRCKLVVELYAMFQDENNVYIVMEYAPKGTVHSLVQGAKPKTLAEDVVWKLTLQSALGLHHIHSLKILHRDIKAENIFLDKDGNAKIGDLGVAKVMTRTVDFAKTLVGTPYYLSPELCENKPYNHKSDVWSLGCVVYEMMTGSHPFNAQNQGALFIKILLN